MRSLSRTRATFLLGLLSIVAGPCNGQVQPPESTIRLERRMVALDLTSLSGQVEKREDTAPCNPPPQGKGFVVRESRGDGFTVDACGRVRRESSALAPTPTASQASRKAAASAPLTIDLMTTRISNNSYAPGGTITLLGSASVYTLGDGSQWSSGAGSFREHWAMLVSVEVSGTSIRYVLSPPEVGLVYEQTDFDSGDHSAQGTLAASGPLVIEAQAGSTTAVLRGNAVIASNPATSYGEPRFNYYSAVVGSVVPFETTYTIQGDTWNATTFTRPFSFAGAGSVDFAHPVSTPRPIALSISGPPRIPDESVTTFSATVLYENGVPRNVTSIAAWAVEPAGFASIAGGALSAGKLLVPQQVLTLRATYIEGVDTLIAEKLVTCMADSPAEKPDTWPMFQANARHTGYLPISIDPKGFRLRWQKNVGGGFALNPVAAGDGKVFVTLLSYFSNVPSLFALYARDGSTLWTKTFGSVFSVNPPSYAWGSVYLQTGNHGADTWLRAYDGNTGDPIFQSPHTAQWERYYAPTLNDGKVYVDGGTFGGMYAFDAYSGAQLWYATLPQYDQWTPAVDNGRAYAYVGSYTPGLYVKDSLTGVPAANFAADPTFSWNGWSMNLAPVIGPHDDAIAIHDGRLIAFDHVQGTIRWQVRSQFQDQPSLAKDRIYAIDGGNLVVLDELTHDVLWSWQPPSGVLSGPMIVTDSHVLASASGGVHAIDLATHESVWSYPAAGNLAFADGTLYVASSGGTLTAIAPPGPTPFFTVSPCRAVDTRSVSGAPEGGPALDALVPRTLHIAGNCGLPATARAVSVNITVTQAGAPGYVNLYAAGDAEPPTSTISYSAGQTRANNAIVSLNQAGDLAAVANQSAGTTVHLIIDVNGYFE